MRRSQGASGNECPDNHCADQEQQRAEQASQRAEQEQQRAERLAARLRALGIEPDE